MNLKMKGLIGITIVCALLASLFGTPLVSSTPKTTKDAFNFVRGSGPLATEVGYVDLTVPSGKTETSIPIEGYRQITLSIVYTDPNSILPVGDSVLVNIGTMVTAGNQNVTMGSDHFFWPDVTGNTYQVEGSFLQVVILNKIIPSVTCNLKVVCYLTE